MHEVKKLSFWGTLFSQKNKRQTVAEQMMKMVRATHNINERSLHRFMAKQSHRPRAALCSIPALSSSYFYHMCNILFGLLDDVNGLMGVENINMTSS